MSIIRDASPSSAFNSSSVNWTYWSLANSYPLTSALRSTTSLHVGQICCCRMRPPHFWCSWLNETPPDDTDENILIGIETRPKEMFPDPMECGGIFVFLPKGQGPKASTAICYPQRRPRCHRPSAPETLS